MASIEAQYKTPDTITLEEYRRQREQAKVVRHVSWSPRTGAKDD